jgi:hypothetical protein
MLFLQVATVPQGGIHKDTQDQTTGIDQSVRLRPVFDPLIEVVAHSDIVFRKFLV